MSELRALLEDGWEASGLREIDSKESEGFQATLTPKPGELLSGDRSALLSEGYSSYRQRQMQEAARPEGAGFWGSMGTAVDREWVGPALQRQGERLKYKEFDASYTLPKQELEKLVLTHSPREIEYLQGSVSDGDYQDRLEDINEDRQSQKLINEAGLEGVAASFVAAALDPLVWTIGLATSPATGTAKATRISNTLKGMGVGALENSVIGAALYSGNTQATEKDIYIAALAGGAIGGGIGAATRIRKADKPLDEVVIQKIDEVDNTLKDVSYEMRQQQAQEMFMTVKYGQQVDVFQPEDIAALTRQRIEARANKREMGAKQLVRVAGRKADAEVQIATLRRERKAAIAAHWARVGVNRGYKRHMDNVRAFDIGREYDTKIDSLLSRLEADQAKLDANDAIFTARAELREWDLMTPEQQVKKAVEGQIPPTSRSVKMEIDRYNKAAEQARVAEVNFEQSFKAVEEPKSVGAAEAKPAREQVYPRTDVEPEENWMQENMYSTMSHTAKHGTNFNTSIPEVLLSDYTNLDNSINMQVRTLNHVFNENGQSVANGHSVAVLKEINDLDIRRAGGNSLDNGFHLYLKENNIGTVAGYSNPRHREAFDKKVAAVVKGIEEMPQQEGSAIKIAVDGVRAQFKRALELRKNAGEFGFADRTEQVRNPEHLKIERQLTAAKEKDPESPDYQSTIAELESQLEATPRTVDKQVKGVEYNDNYFPDIMHRDAFVDLLFNKGWEANDVKKLIALGYRTGGNELSEAQAKLVAELKYKSAMDAHLYDGDVRAIYNARSAAEAEQLLKAAKVPQEIIDDFFRDALSKEDWKQVSNRARKSLHINWDAELNGVKIGDLMNTNTSQVLEAYTKESAFGAAMAERGIKSEGMLARIMSQAKRQAADDLKQFGEDSEQFRKMLDEFRTLENTLTQLRGRPLVDYSGKFKTINRLGRMMLDATAILRLQQVGFSSIPELARGITSAGLAEIVRSVPGSGALRLPFTHTRDPKTMRNLVDDMEELEEIIGFVGENEMNSSFSVRSEDFGSDASGKFLQTADNILEGTRRASTWLSLHQTIQGGMEKIVARAASRRMLKDALGKQEMTRSMRDQLRLAGMTPERWAEISKWVKANPSKGELNGRPIDKWGFSEMPADMRRDLQVTMKRIQNRNVQRGMIGETNSNWIGPVGRFLTQFKSFSLVSLEKQLIADVRGDKYAAASTFLWGTGLAYAAYMAQMNLRALGMPEDKAEKYLADNTEGKNLAWGVFNKHSQLAAAGILSDIGIMTGVAPKELYDSSRYGYQTGKLDSMVPALGLANDALSASGATANLVFDRFRDDKTMQDSWKDWFVENRKVMPFANTIWFGEYLKTITGNNED